MSDELLRHLFGRTEIHCAFERPAIEIKAAVKAERPLFLGRFVADKPKVGPRGGEGNRAKTKAARKANLRRRMQR